MIKLHFRYDTFKHVRKNHGKEITVITWLDDSRHLKRSSKKLVWVQNSSEHTKEKV